MKQQTTDGNRKEVNTMTVKECHEVEPRMLTQKQAEVYTGLGRNSLTDFARRIGARRKVGRTVLYDRVILDAGLDALPEDTGEPAAI